MGAFQARLNAPFIVMLGYSGDIETRDVDGLTAMDHAQRAGEIAIVALLDAERAKRAD